MDKYQRNALRYANKIRRKLGLKPVDHLYQGRRRRSDNCPITNTIYNDDPLDNYEVLTETLYVRVTDNQGHTIIEEVSPPTVIAFVTRFDEGLYPDLDAGEGLE